MSYFCRIYNIKNGKQKKTYKGSIGDDGTLIKVQLDPSGAYVATSCSDKNLALYEFFSGECMATMFGHSELVTGIKFMNNMRHVISVSGDGWVWAKSNEIETDDILLYSCNYFKCWLLEYKHRTLLVNTTELWLFVCSDECVFVWFSSVRSCDNHPRSVLL